MPQPTKTQQPLLFNCSPENSFFVEDKKSHNKSLAKKETIINQQLKWIAKKVLSSQVHGQEKCYLDGLNCPPKNLKCDNRKKNPRKKQIKNQIFLNPQFTVSKLNIV
jgi:hypothetical protein